jgi:ATP-dependent helicase IRC3
VSLTLRPYQEEAVAAIEGALDRGVKRSLVALPTGTGKTPVACELIRRRGGTALVLAHRDELLGQAEDKMQLVAPELAMSLGRVQAERDDTHAPIVFASVQTLASERRLARLPTDYDTVIVDECHHATAPTYRRILDHINAGCVAGFTATPERHDKSRLRDVFEEIVYARSLLQMIEDGYLCNLTGLRVELEDLDLSDVKVSRGDYQADDLGRALDEAHAPEHTAACLLEHAPERKSLVFVPTVELAHKTAAAINAAGIPAAALDGTTPKDERREILAKLRSGEVRVVVNVDVLTEGFDEPSVDCIAIGSPTRSRIAYVQRVGRGTRTHPGCLVLDLVGVSDDLKLQSLPALFDLEAQPKRGESVTEAIEREKVEAAKNEEEKRQAEADAKKRRARGADLFNRDRLHWVHVDERWVMSFGEGELLTLDPHETGWRVLRVRETGAQILARGLDLGYAQGAAEEAVRMRGTVRLADKEAGWRKDTATKGQLAYLWRLGVQTKPENKGHAADLITEANARLLLAKLDAAVGRERETVAA